MRTHGHRAGNITHQSLLVGDGLGEGLQRVGDWGEIALGETPNVDEGAEGSKSHCHMCIYATILHVPKT